MTSPSDLEPVPTKPGFATTEFWVTLTPLVAVLLPLFHIVSTPEQLREVMAAVAGLVGAAYVIGRALVKAAHLKAVATVNAPSPLPAVTTLEPLLGEVKAAGPAAPTADEVADAVIHRLNAHEGVKTTTHHKTPARSD